MSTVAEQLRAAREAKNLTVEQVAESTKIRTDHIRALEEGNFNVFSAPIYIRGSVKNYGSWLKLDTVQILTALDAELSGTKNFAAPPPLGESKKTWLDHATLILAKLNWKLGLAGIVVVAVMVLAGSSFLAWRHHQKSDPLKNLPPAVYSPANSGDTLPLPGHK
jgi:cytoskeletal protein RodZ